MTNIWTHSICIYCWDQKNPGREPVKLKEPELRLCCYCGETTKEGIFVRDDGRNLLCKGVHP